MPEKSFSLLFYLKKPKNYRKGTMPIYLRIIVNGIVILCMPLFNRLAGTAVNVAIINGSYGFLYYLLYHSLMNYPTKVCSSHEQTFSSGLYASYSRYLPELLRLLTPHCTYHLLNRLKY